MQDECVPIDCVVAGGGVVGLAVARAMALSGRDTILLEAGPAIGGGISSRNSEVIHAGIYYPADSLKARLCVQGKALLYAYAAERGVPHKRLGKLIVASDEEELPTLEVIRAKAARNGVGDLEAMSGAEAGRLEPALRAAGALFSPSTGIIDSHALMLALQGDFENAGGTVIARSSVSHGAVQPGGSVRLQVGGAEPMALDCGLFVNATGLHAPDLARRIEGIPGEAIPTAFMCKGSYYALQGRAPFSHLIYPVPEKAGLGVHLTLDLAGQARFGPDTEWVGTEEYDVDLARAAGFYAAIRRYWPGLRDGALVPAYAGIRPKISAPDAPNADFAIGRPVPGVVNLFGIESPGLTASLAIAGLVGEMVAAG